MKDTEFINHVGVGTFFTCTVVILSLVSYVTYWSGKRLENRDRATPSDLISTNVLGLLALILGFSFSMAIERYENRRRLNIEEANAISTAYLRSGLIKFERPEEVKNLFKHFVDLRIQAYVDPKPVYLILANRQVEKEIWKHFQAVSVRDRGEIESAYLQSLNEMFDISNARNFAFRKMLPSTFYILILILASAAIGLINFDRGYHNDQSHVRSFLFVVLFAIMFSFIFDMDHFRSGFVTIGQEPLLLLKKIM